GGCHDLTQPAGLATAAAEQTGAVQHLSGCDPHLPAQHQPLSHPVATAARIRAAASSGTISATNAPIAASDPARYLILSTPPRIEARCRCNRTVPLPVCTGA